MSDRGMLFLFSLLMVVAGLGTAGWLVVSGQAGSVDGLFLLLSCLLAALAFALYLVFMVRRAMAESAPAPAQPAKAPAAASKPAAATASQPAQPVQTS